jgi:peptidoglycan/xylan/chitin deacetylase (PgdA/CDA1 family)
MKRVPFAISLCSALMAWRALSLADMPGYACTNGTYPQSVCASTSPPAGLAPPQTPQMVLLSFDDSVTTASYALVRQVLQGHVNPNGESIQATFFVSMDGKYDPVSINQLWADGHEIAVHTITHQTSTNSSFDAWRSNMVGGRWYLSELAAIPESEIRGFRAPYLQPNDAAYQVLYTWGFDYDSSLPERFGGLSAAPDSMIWPYTFDNGVAQVVSSNVAPQRPYPGLFEVPLWALTSVTGGVAAIMDAPESYDYDAVLTMWQTNFHAHYHGNRVPLNLGLHATAPGQWLSNTNYPWRVAVVSNFIAWALAQGSDVWFVSYSDLIDYMRAPFDSAAAVTAELFRTISRPAYPSSTVSMCTYPSGGNLRVCGECPPVYPSTGSVYLVLGSPTGGAVSFVISSQDSIWAYGCIVISNNTGATRYDWEAQFDLTAGSFQQCYDAVYTQQGERVTLRAKPYNTHLFPDQSREIAFAVKHNGQPFDIVSNSLALWGLERPPPVLTNAQLSGGDIELGWTETAYSYDIETCTDPALSAWTAATCGHVRWSGKWSASPAEPCRYWRILGRND